MTENLAYLFPGQGAQEVGMGRDLYEQFPAAKKIFDQADQILGYAISKICFEGPEEALTKTCYAQPAIFVASLAALAVLKEKFPELRPAVTAGLSLGEFTALVACGTLAMEDGLALVKIRAEAMERSAGIHPGTMASIIGLSGADCEKIAQEAGCEVANLNSPDQIAVSGTHASIEKACQLAEAKGAKRAVVLKVGGAFHSTLMKEAKDDLENALRQTHLRKPDCLFIPNVLAEPVADPDQIRGLLARQLMSPVRWSGTMEQLGKLAIKQALEIGPGKILKGLARKFPDLNVIPCGTVADMPRLGERLNHQITS